MVFMLFDAVCINLWSLMNQCLIRPRELERFSSQISLEWNQIFSETRGKIQQDNEKLQDELKKFKKRENLFIILRGPFSRA